MLSSVYPFEFYGDGGWNPMKSMASIGFVVKDSGKMLLDWGGKVVDLYFPSNVTAECRAIHEIVVNQVPYYCNKTFSRSYENGRRVIVKTDNDIVHMLLHGHKPRKKSGETEELLSYLNDIRKMQRKYDIKFVRISSQENIAHELCKKARKECIANFSKKKANKEKKQKYYKISLTRNFL